LIPVKCPNAYAHKQEELEHDAEPGAGARARGIGRTKEAGTAKLVALFVCG
jgi:hypothetical protein